MVSDLILGAFCPGLVEPPMLAHHLAVIAMFSLALMSNYTVQLQVLFLVNEASTPFVNLYFLMRVHGYEQRWAMIANGLSMW